MTNLKRIAFMGLLMGMAFVVVAYASQMDSKFATTESDRAEMNATEQVQVRTPANEVETNKDSNRREVTRNAGVK